MKIAIVHEILVKLGGAERVLKVLADMFPNAPIYTLFHNAEKTDDWFKGRDIRTSSLQKSYSLLKKQRLLLPKMRRAIEEFDFSDFDVVISSSSGFAHGIKTGPNTKHINYCHSPMRYAWDYTHQYTKRYSKLMQWAIAKTLTPIRIWDSETASRPNVIIANSKHVKKRVSKYWRKDAKVIYPPVNIRRFEPRKEHEDYFLIVSALTPFKQIDLAIQTFNKIRRKLVIIGSGPQMSYLKSIAKDNIEFLGYKSDEVVKEYIENCRALIFPGEEDFGITPVEAMAAGKPVLAYQVGGVTETVIPGISGEFFNKPTSASLEDGLARLLANEKNYDPKAIRAVAEKFSEAKFKKEVKGLIRGS